MSNYTVVDNTVLSNLWNASKGDIATATRLFNTLLDSDSTLVITDTVKAEATISLNDPNPYPKDVFINNWINANSVQISQPVTGLPPGGDNGELSISQRRFRVMAAALFMATSVSWGAIHAKDLSSPSDVPTDISQALPELRYVETLQAPNEKFGMFRSGTSRLTWSPDGKRLAAYVHSGLGIITWSPDGKDQREFPRHTNFGLDAYLLGFVAGHSQIVVSPAAGVKDPDEEVRVQQNAFSVMDAETGKVLRGVPGPNPGKTFRENIAQHLSISPDQRLVAVIYHPYAGRSIGIYSTQNWERVGAIDLGDGKRTPDPQVVTFSPDGKKLAVARGDNSQVDIFEVGSWKMLRSVETFPETPPPMHVLSLGALSFSSDGSMIAVGSRSGGIHRKYPDGTPAPIGEGELVEEFPRDPLRVFRVADGSLVASAGGFPGGLGDEYKLAWSPNTEFIAFLDTDRHLRLWNPKHADPPATALKLEHSAGGIAFSPDGTQLAINFADGVKIFNVVANESR